MRYSRSAAGADFGFVEDGFRRLRAGIDAQVRPEVEARYAEALAAAGLLRRLRIRREMEREIARLVAERTAKVSEQSLF